MTDKTRVHILAKELDVQSKVIIAKCKAEGLTVTNHMSTLSAGLEATIREWFSEGQHLTTLETTLRVDLKKVRTRKKKPSATKRTTKETEAADQVAVQTADASVVEATASAEPAPAVAAEPKVPAAAEIATATEAVDQEQEPGSPTSVPAVGEPDLTQEARAAAKASEVTAAPEASDPESPPRPITPAGPQNVPAPARLKGPRVVRYEAPEATLRPMGPSPPGSQRPNLPIPPSSGSGVGVPEVGDRQRDHSKPPGDQARRGRSSRRYSTAEVAKEKLKEWRDRDLVERRERISGATGRRIGTHRVAEAAAPSARAARAEPKTEASIQEPIMMKDLCSVIGISMIQMLPILKREFGVVGNINMGLTAEMAELIAVEHGINLTVMPAKTALDEIQEEFSNRKRHQLKPRPPVVTFLGHVDHGKTSLLDAIRSTQVAAKEDGGITQHIGAYHLRNEAAGNVTFLDTPGHAAFTAMRARGAAITDIVVLVVAADDGVMPQTVEAVNHAKAAGVPVVVALNKIDLGHQNLNKIYGQLAEQGLAPAGDWGGETDVIATSATTGEGINALVEHLAALGEVLDLQADYQGDATGTVIEAETKEGDGAMVRVLVQQGTLRTGSIVVCGNAFGRVRALIDDRGERIQKAEPSIPVEVWGLDAVPAAGDRFYQVKSTQRAKTIAEDLRRRRVSESRAESRRFRSLEDVFRQRDIGEIPELNVILKADVDGSVDALRSMLERIPTDEVRLTIRHAGVGAVTDSDILLADASDAIVIGFRVTPGAGAKRLAEERSVDVRQYKVIYDVAEDITKALEGLLVPDEKMEHRARCEVRSVFRITKLGTVAGCVVADGTVYRNHLIRLIRDGVVVREGSKIGSLRRFKDDVKEVRAGMECGIRIEGFDDVKTGDVIETYEIVKLARKLVVT